MGNPLPLNESADWCTKPWSYVNPCECTASDMALALTTYFDLELCYSYSNLQRVRGHRHLHAAVTITDTSDQPDELAILALHKRPAGRL